MTRGATRGAPEVLPLARARILLWASEPGAHTADAFEVSRVVTHPLQPRCASAPHCPPARTPSPFRERPTWIDPDEPPRADCPYAFELRGECLLHRNQRALELALFHPSEARLITRLLRALGYTVSEEHLTPADEADEARILHAHSLLGPSHEVRVVAAPGGRVVLVRRRSGHPRPLRGLP